MLNWNCELSLQCGADFVKVNQKGPAKISIEAGHRYVSFDGDSDRIIYFYYDRNLKFRMLDGDKIAVLFACHLGDLVKRSGSELPQLNLGIVQSAYANGSSTNYIQNILVRGILACNC
jgi:phosphoacetylglucosamine mutase